jgi:hypothetical protein
VSSTAVGFHCVSAGGGCEPGYTCVPGSNTTASQPCPAGQYNVAYNSSTCQQCASGRFGGVVALASSDCSGLCPAGQYSDAGSSNCPMCRGGRYGRVDGMNSSSCSGVCTAGYECPPGSTNSTATACVAGRYSHEGADSCSECPEGHYCTVAASGGTSCGAEPPGYYCSEGSATASGLPCPPGRFSIGKGICDCSSTLLLCAIPSLKRRVGV